MSVVTRGEAARETLLGEGRIVEKGSLTGARGATKRVRKMEIRRSKVPEVRNTAYRRTTKGNVHKRKGHAVVDAWRNAEMAIADVQQD